MFNCSCLTILFKDMTSSSLAYKSPANFKFAALLYYIMFQPFAFLKMQSFKLLFFQSLLYTLIFFLYSHSVNKFITKSFHIYCLLQLFYSIEYLSHTWKDAKENSSISWPYDELLTVSIPDSIFFPSFTSLSFPRDSFRLFILIDQFKTVTHNYPLPHFWNSPCIPLIWCTFFNNRCKG